MLPLGMTRAHIVDAAPTSRRENQSKEESYPVGRPDSLGVMSPRGMKGILSMVLARQPSSGKPDIGVGSPKTGFPLPPTMDVPNIRNMSNDKETMCKAQV